MSNRVRRPPPADHVTPKPQLVSPWAAASEHIAKSWADACEDSRASRSPARRLYPTAEDRARQAKAPKREPQAKPSLSQDRSAVSPLGGLAK
jgi:hypothetical protein